MCIVGREKDFPLASTFTLEFEAWDHVYMGVLGLASINKYLCYQAGVAIPHKRLQTV